jgi:hypothetical protein
MAPTQPNRRETRWYWAALTGAWFLSVGAGGGVLLAWLSWIALCEDGTFARCPNGHPVFELWFQVLLAAAGFGATILTWALVKRQSYRLAAAALVIAVLLLAAWAVVLDAATHGWDNLKLLWLG